MESLGKPSGLREFINSCGANSDAYTKKGKSDVKSVLIKMSKLIPTSNNENTFAHTQGIKGLLKNESLMQKENFESESSENDDCRKDNGEVGALRRRSRGFEAFVTGGGIIKKISPIYNSEGPTQILLLIINFLQLFLKNVNPNSWSKLYLAFDNMCHIDNLKMLKKPLPLDGPDMPDVWNRINKVIDPLHILNHKNKKCLETYHPDKVKESFPEANMMVCEQTFAWLGRFKKILNSTPKTNAHFLLHRLVLARNRYTEHCYKENRKPLLPSAKAAKASDSNVFDE